MILTRDTEDVVVGCPRWWKKKCQGPCGRVKMMPFGNEICPYCDASAKRRIVKRAYRLLQLPSLKHVRCARGLSQERLAAICGISYVTVANIESDRKQTRYATARMLAAALGVDVEDLQRTEPMEEYTWRR